MLKEKLLLGTKRYLFYFLVMHPVGEKEKWVQGNQIPLQGGGAQAAQNPLSLPNLGTWSDVGKWKGRSRAWW